MLTDELKRAAADVKCLRKRCEFWRGKVTRELNKAAAIEHKVAAGEEVWFPSVEIQNCRTAADNYRAIAEEYAAQLRKAEAEVARLRSSHPQSSTK